MELTLQPMNPSFLLIRQSRFSGYLKVRKSWTKVLNDFMKLRQRLIATIFLCELLFFGSDNRVIASPKFKSSEDPALEEKFRLDRSLNLIEEMDDSQLKVMLFNDLALSQARLGNLDQAIAILEQSLSLAKSFEDVALKVTTITNIAKCYAQIGQKPQAIEILDNTVALAI